MSEQYFLVMTHNGFIPVPEIKAGTEVYCRGEWKSAPEPVKAKSVRLSFMTLPTVSFEYGTVTGKQIAVNHNFIYNELEEPDIGLTVRAYLNVKNRKSAWVALSDKSMLYYWYPKWIKFFNRTREPIVKDKSISYYCEYPECKPLSGNQLAERNLEYYLEGMLRKRFFMPEGSKERPVISDFRYADETDKLVMRLLGIDLHIVPLGTSIDNAYDLFCHVKDELSKSMIPPLQFELALRRKVELPQYTLSEPATKVEETEDWILPGINPDINGMNPKVESGMIASYVPGQNVATVKYDKYGRRVGNYNKNNLWDKLGCES